MEQYFVGRGCLQRHSPEAPLGEQVRDTQNSKSRNWRPLLGILTALKTIGQSKFIQRVSPIDRWFSKKRRLSTSFVPTSAPSSGPTSSRRKSWKKFKGTLKSLTISRNVSLLANWKEHNSSWSCRDPAENLHWAVERKEVVMAYSQQVGCQEPPRCKETLM